MAIEGYGHAPPFMRIQYADRWLDEPYTRDPVTVESARI
jgi:hypothetical protein